MCRNGADRFWDAWMPLMQADWGGQLRLGAYTAELSRCRGQTLSEEVMNVSAAQKSILPHWHNPIRFAQPRVNRSERRNL